MANDRSLEQEHLRRLVQIWKDAAPELEAIRHREIVEADNLKVLQLLEPAFNHAARLPMRETSGMVEMQAIFQKIRLRSQKQA